jgi:hypothetical protein
MLLSDVDLKPYTDTAYHNEELESLTRCRFDEVKEWSKFKQFIARLVAFYFPNWKNWCPPCTWYPFMPCLRSFRRSSDCRCAPDTAENVAT